MNILFKYHSIKSLILTLLMVLSACSGSQVKQIPSANHNDRIRYLVIHYTTIDYKESVEVLTKKDSVSAHYLVPESTDPSYGSDKIVPIQLVDESKRAWHAGQSYWQGQQNLNDQSIGIENVYKAPCPLKQSNGGDENTGQKNDPTLDSSRLNIQATSDRICFYPDFDPKQIDALIQLIKGILARNPEITPSRIVGHADITPDRRVDPGPRFPWYQLYQAGIGAWYDQARVTHYWQMFQPDPIDVGLTQAALRAYGYGVLETGVLDAATINALTVFQMHFRPWKVDGKPSAETLATLFALIEKYRNSRLEKLTRRYQQQKQTQTIRSLDSPGQFAQIFPDTNPSSRQLVNQRRRFKSYADSGKIEITSLGTTSANIWINGKRLKLKKTLSKNISFRQSIAKYTRNGFNSLKVENIQPANSQLKIQIPYPQLNQSTAKQVGFDKNKLKKIDQYIQAEVMQGFPGAVLLIAKDGKIIKHSAYGFAKRYDRNGKLLSSPIKMQKETLFDLASNTKMFATNFAMMKLASENKLNVNLPIHYYLADYQGDGRESRLVKDLLTHTAGYPPVIDFHRRDNRLGEAFFSQNKAHTQHLLIEKAPFIRGRNIKMQYSDVDYMLVGTLLERITGMPLDEYVEKQIYQPLGLTHTLFNPLQKGIKKQQIAATELMGNTRHATISFDNIRSQVIQGEVHDEKAFYSMQGVSGHAGLFSNAKELAILASVILNRGGYGDVKLFDPSQLDQFLKPSELDITMGLGWRRAGNGERQWQFGPYASPYAIGHTGWTGTVTVIDPFYDLVIVLLTNKKHSPMVNSEKGLIFSGDEFQTGQYGSIVSLVYEAFLEKN
ncbi:MAG: penicillin binding protein PBP4B [Enterobacterales bacterium]|nr:penicillin binding protein PBP4B [Enterobacterales bacterium]